MPRIIDASRDIFDEKSEDSRVIALALSGISIASIAASGSSLLEARRALTCDFAIGRRDQLRLNDYTVVALILGGLATAVAADRLGRAKPLVASLALYGLSTLGLGVCGGYRCFAIFSVLRAFGVAASLCVLTVHVAEVASPGHRGAGQCFLQLCRSVGSVLPTPAWGIGWQMSQCLHGTTALLAACAVLHLCGESPRRSLSLGKNAEALESIEEIFSSDTGRKKEDFPVRKPADEPRSGGFRDYVPRSTRPPWYCGIVSVQVAFAFNLCLYTMAWWFPEISYRHALLFPRTIDALKCRNDERPLARNYLPAGLRADESNAGPPEKSEKSCYEETARNYFHDEATVVTLAALPVIAWMILYIDHLGRVYFIVLGHALAGLLSFVAHFLVDSPRSLVYACLMESLSVVSLTASRCTVAEFFPARRRALGIAILHGLGYAGMAIGIGGWYISRNTCTFVTSSLGVIVTEARTLAWGVSVDPRSLRASRPLTTFLLFLVSGFLTLALPDSTGTILR